ncbi:hypothetical protein [Brevundimonas sp. SGAir0440]|uniref:hypothetical protein n=1 Tax=Brevundimonas sp. SGAir0440 TaxID=2579977 RepID=UPI0010CD37D2|nr:hypothetical protein [Brevundimonas sp. SGAir0440]QCQ98174.1 hypothetical protein E7T10_05575 [Brevundimonas sp. SGAir0440]
MDMTSNGRGGAPERRPGRIFYLLAALPAICGIVAMVVLLATKLPALDDGLEQIVVPGGRDLALKPGDHTVFLEYRSVVDGRVYVVEDVNGLAVKVQAADGKAVPTRTPGASSTYTFGGRQGQSIQAFRIDRAGTYRVSGDYDGRDGPQAVIAVGQGFMTGMFVTILSALGAFFGGIFLSVIGVAWVAWSRRRTPR